MANRFFTLAGGTLLGVILTSATLFSCHHLGSDPAATSQLSANTAAASEISTLPANELREVLSEFAKSHADHVKLSWWVSTPLRPVDAAFKPFFDNMGKHNRELASQLKDWAKAHKVNLAHVEKPSFESGVQRIMDKRQEDLVRHADKPNFQHDILMQMYNDYEWNLSELQTLIPLVLDPALKEYLQKSAKMYSDGSDEILALLHRYKFQ